MHFSSKLFQIMAFNAITMKKSQNDDQAAINKLSDIWSKLKDEVYSLERYPKFEENAKEYIKFKIHQNEQIDPQTLDELIYLLEMMETTLKHIVTISKINSRNLATSENIEGILKEEFSLLATGIINQDIIEELTNLILHLMI